MNRKFLEDLGLEKEAIDKIMAEHGKTVNATKEKADKAEALQSQIDDYKQQIKDRDNQLEELKKVDAGALEKTISELQEANKTQKSEHEEKIAKQQKEFAIELALRDAGALNSKAVKALLDTESIKLDGETLLGLDDQVKALQESDAYLFKQQQNPNSPQIFVPGNPNGGGNGTLTKAEIMKEKDTAKRQQMIRENSHLFQ